MKRGPLEESLQALRSACAEAVARQFSEMDGQIRSAAAREADEHATAAQRRLTDRLHQSARRLFSAGSRAEWARAVVEMSRYFCGMAALFRVSRGELSPEEEWGTAGKLGDIRIPLASAPAFENAIQTKDVIVTVRSEKELSSPVAEWSGGGGTARVYLVPIAAGGRVEAVLDAEAGAGAIDLSGLELLATIAGAALERLQRRERGGRTGPAQDSEPPSVAEAAMPEEMRLRAERFARTRTAELILHRPREVARGRQERNLYGSLEEEIETARAAYREQFLSADPRFPDYLHRELATTLVRGDEAALGPDYPGPLS
jgi:hypothetical protein